MLNNKFMYMHKYIDPCTYLLMLHMYILLHMVACDYVSLMTAFFVFFCFFASFLLFAPFSKLTLGLKMCKNTLAWNARLVNTQYIHMCFDGHTHVHTMIHLRFLLLSCSLHCGYDYNNNLISNLIASE